jgi:hypothetical protein
LFFAAQPGADTGKVSDVVEHLGEIQPGDQKLAGLLELDALAQDLPGGIIVAHHLVAGIDVKVADVDTLRIFAAKVLKDGFAEGAQDFASCASKSDD